MERALELLNDDEALRELDEMVSDDEGDGTVEGVEAGAVEGSVAEESLAESMLSSQAVQSQGTEGTELLSTISKQDMAELDAQAEDPLEASLTLNEMYIEGVDAVIARFEEALDKVRGLVRRTEEAGGGPQQLAATPDSTGKRRKTTKVPALTYVNPYFKDGDNMACPPNPDALRKAAEGEFDMLVQPAKRWSKAEKDELEAAVEKEVMRIATDRQRQRLDIVRDKVKQAGANLTEEERERLKEDTEAIRSEMAATKASQAAILRSFVDWDTVDWLAIANEALKGARSARDCRLKWETELCPQWSRDNWATDELARLKEIISAFPDGKVCGQDWDKVAQELGTRRTAWQVFEVYQSQLNKSLISGPWSKEEDERLVNVVEELRMGDEVPWDNVAHAMEGRTRAQVHARWSRTLNPTVKRGRWTEDEDFILLVTVGKFGARDWGKVAAQVPCRTDTQCRERWLSFLTDEVDYGPWSPEEDDVLRETVGVFGVGSWSRCAKALPKRTAGMAKTRWARLAKLKEEMEAAIAEAAENGERPPTMEQLEKTIVEPHINYSEDRKGRMVERKERLLARYEQMMGEPFQGTTARDADTAAQDEEDLELALNTFPTELRARLMGKLAKLRWRHHGTESNAAKDEPALRSRNILGASVAAALKAKPRQAPAFIRGRTNMDKNPVERAQLIQELRRSLNIIDKSAALKAKKDLQRQSYYRNVGLFTRALKEGRLLPPSRSSLALFSGLQLAGPSIRLSAQELRGEGVSGTGSGLARLPEANVKALRACLPYRQLKAALLSATAWPRALASIPVSGWDRPGAIKVLKLETLLAQPSASSASAQGPSTSGQGASERKRPRDLQDEDPDRPGPSGLNARSAKSPRKSLTS